MFEELSLLEIVVVLSEIVTLEATCKTSDKYGGSHAQLKKLNLVPKNFNLVQKNQFSAENIQLTAKKL